MKNLLNLKPEHAKVKIQKAASLNEAPQRLSKIDNRNDKRRQASTIQAVVSKERQFKRQSQTEHDCRH